MPTDSFMNDEYRPLIRSTRSLPPREPHQYTSTAFPKRQNLRYAIFVPLLLLALYFADVPRSANNLITNGIPNPLKKSLLLNPDGLPLENSLTFIAIGDWGRKGKHHQKRVANAMVKVIKRLHNTVRFVVSTGDNFYEGGVDGVHDKQWNKSFEHVYNGKAFDGLTWWSILGNHDHLGDIEAQQKYGVKNTRWNMPSTYYDRLFRVSVDEKSSEEVHFVFLDTTPYVQDGYGKEARKKNGQHPKEQTEWFRKVMNERKAEMVVIVMHHQMYTMSIAGHFGTREGRAAFEPVILEHRHRVMAVISGHEHLMEHLQPYGGNHQWKGLASRIATKEMQESGGVWGKMKKMTGVRNKGNGVVDYFISGSGSQLDPLKRPPRKYESIWLDCCSVLPLSENVKVPRAVFGKREHGFFVFSIMEKKLFVKAFDEKANVLYEYEKEF